MVNTVSAHGLGLYLRRVFTSITALFLIFSPTFLSAGDTQLIDKKNDLIPTQNYRPAAISNTALPAKINGNNLKDCVTKLTRQGAGWCEISVSKQHPSISSVWPKNLDKKTRMRTGPASILIAWNGAAFDKEKEYSIFLAVVIKTMVVMRSIVSNLTVVNGNA